MDDRPFLTDEMIDEIQMRFGGPCFECYDDLRFAYNLGYAQALKDVHVEDLIKALTEEQQK